MYSQTITERQDILNDLTEKNRTAQNVSFSSNQAAQLASLELDKLYNLVNELLTTLLSVNMEFSTQTPRIYLYEKRNTPTFIWLSYVNELLSSPFLSIATPKKRLSAEIVKRYSLSEVIQKIYFSQASYYVNVDVLLNCENLLDEQLEIFFEYEKQLLSMFNLPINFNYHLKDTFLAHTDNVLIFER